MNKKLISALIAVVALVASLWVYQAMLAEHVFVIHIPTWVAGSPVKRYSIAIGKSQTHPFCTLWTTEYFTSRDGSFVGTATFPH